MTLQKYLFPVKKEDLIHSYPKPYKWQKLDEFTYLIWYK